MVEFNKPKELRYVDCAIAVDERFKKYPEEPLTQEEEDKMYEYIYYLCYMVSCKKRLFQIKQDYDDFCRYATGIYLMRMLNLKQFEEGSKLKKIKSILNYIKKTIYQIGVDWKRHNYAQVLNPEVFANLDTSIIKRNMELTISQTYEDKVNSDLIEDFKWLPKRLKEIIDKSYYRGDKVLCHRIYMSCLLTLIDSVTLSNSDIRRLKKNSLRSLDGLINKFYFRCDNNIILWHTDLKYKSYIAFIVNKVRRDFVEQIHDTYSFNQLSESTLDDIMDSVYDAWGAQDLVDIKEV